MPMKNPPYPGRSIKDACLEPLGSPCSRLRLWAAIGSCGAVVGRVIQVAFPYRLYPSCQLVGQSHGGFVVAALLLKPQAPLLERGWRDRGSVRRPQDGSRPVDQQHPQITVAPLTDPAQPSSQTGSSGLRGSQPEGQPRQVHP